ncbi:MAG: LarC family nickel insertion protein, partial [Gammaproteobacteria bacterium]|nr:LarC family nickel insertion protein [Gammaproteobacteria bacterium]
ASLLSEKTKQISLDIFRLLAEAEATVHGKAIEDVAFHEVGAWDSIADIISAAWLIEQAGITSTSVSSLPMGGGRVKTAHGSLPVPAPATERLLRGFEFIDDGISGERITPTGAAILKFLKPGEKPASSMLLGSGYGFGSKTFPGISNVTRVSFFDVNKTSTTQSWQEDRVVQLNFEIDDQTPEDLSVALENIRELPGVLDVNQSLAFGKKGRMMFAVQILVVSQAESDVMAQCFEETTTLGIRKIELDRAILNRSEHIVNVGTEKFRTKRASRPGDMTTKVEIDDIAHLPGIRRRSTKADIENQTSEE